MGKFGKILVQDVISRVVKNDEEKERCGINRRYVAGTSCGQPEDECPSLFGFLGLTPSALALDCIFLFFVKSESLARRKPKQVY